MDIDEYFVGYDPSYEVVFHGHWSDWEEDGWIFIFEKERRFFTIEGGHCVMTDDYIPQWEHKEEITQDEALELMLEWEDVEC